jgi:hypothetical protein
MQYREEAAVILSAAIERLEALDQLGTRYPGHRLDSLEPLTERLRRIRADLLKENRMLPAIRKTTELRTRLTGGIAGLNDPTLRSTLASILGSHKRKGDPARARLGGLKGGRPRKDKQPVRTLLSKGYSAEHLPPPKEKGMRVHPNVRDQLRAAKAGVQKS